MSRGTSRQLGALAMWLCLLPGGIAAGGDEPPAADDAAEKLTRQFQELDRDSSGGLSQDEFLATIGDDQRKVFQRNFRVMDFNRDDALSRDEFLAVKWIAVPDPWIARAEQTFQTVQDAFRKADQDGDGKLSRKEWPAQALFNAFRPFGEIERVWWDVNRDEFVDAAELRRIVDLAYGLRTPGGEPARWPNGAVLYWSHLKDVDRNDDFSVSRNEFEAKHWLGKEKNEELFPKLDRDGDGQLSYAELTAPDAPFRVNPVSTFYAFDTDLDGRLNRAELAAQCPAAINNPRALALGMAAFDADGDGGLDLDEFRTAPIGLLYVTVQLLHKKDTNNDGVISWPEFHQVTKPLFAGIAWEVFRRYDTDRDGDLSFDEYDLPEDQQLQQFVQQWEPQVRHVVKTELRFFLTICPLNEAQRAALKPAVAPLLSQLARRMAQANRRVNQGPGNGPKLPDVQILCAERLGEFAAAELPAEISAKYREEIELRTQHRRRAAILAIVARLDRFLLLNDEQRAQIEDALTAQFRSDWISQTGQLMQNSQYMLELPDSYVVPHLTTAQKDVWRTLQKVSFGQSDLREFVGFGVMENQPAEPDLDFFLPAPEPGRERARGPALKIKALDARR